MECIVASEGEDCKDPVSGKSYILQDSTQKSGGKEGKNGKSGRKAPKRRQKQLVAIHVCF